uniref:PPPDE domain-containing protein n=1 Tax=Alexandrium monilatum TaxID=311494 RepID=A0A7S4V0J2_9DINO
MPRGYGRLLPSQARAPPASLRAAEDGAGPGRAAAPVTLHVYHVTGLDAVRRVNKVLRALGTGAFHTGVEVYGQEYSFGFTDDGGSGVFWCPPGECEAHAYLKSIPMGSVAMSEAQVQSLILQLAEEWQGEDYDLLHCNCCHFSQELCRQLGVGPLPRWVTSLAGTGAAMEDQLHTVKAGAQVAAAKAREAQEGTRDALPTGDAIGLNRRGADGFRRSVSAAVADAAAKVRQRARGVLAICGSHAPSCHNSFQSRSYRRCR